MVAAPVKHRAVMRDKEKSTLPAQIPRQRLPSGPIEVIGRLVKEHESVGRKNNGKLQLRALSAESVETGR